MLILLITEEAATSDSADQTGASCSGSTAKAYDARPPSWAGDLRVT